MSPFPPERRADGLAYADLGRLLALEMPARRLGARITRLAAASLIGQHASTLRGRGLDFQELRHYRPGDDLRRLDSRASLRHGTPLVRSFSEERERPALIWVDQRMDMFFGSRRYLKSTLAVELGALLAWSALHGGDRVGGLVFGDRHEERLRPTRNPAGIRAFCAAMLRHNHALSADSAPANGARLNPLLETLLSGPERGGQLYLISDFSGCDEHTRDLLQQLRRRHRILALQVQDPLALQLHGDTPLSLSDGIGWLDLDLRRRTVRHPMQDYLRGRLDSVAEHLRLAQVPLLRLSTAEAPLDQLRRELLRLGVLA